MSTGIILLLDEPRRSRELREALETKSRFTDALSLPDSQIRDKSIALLGFDQDHLHFAALATRGRLVATRKYHVTFTNFVDLDAVSVRELERLLGPNVRRHFVRITASTGEMVPPETWRQLLRAVLELRPGLGPALSELELLAAAAISKQSTSRTQQLAQEKDALLLAERIFGLEFSSERPVFLASADSPELPSFLAGLEYTNTSEDLMIQHDSEVFGLWRLAERWRVGAAQLARGQERLTVLTANRQRLEHSLGVDLIYWHHRYHAYTMVQYKRMAKEGSPPKSVYRPSGSYHGELGQMVKVDTALRQLRAEPQLCRDFRLCGNPFFFKLCHVEPFDPSDQHLTPGMYLPLDYWRILLESDGITGPRGGKVVHFENAGRHLNNTEFVGLVQSGWVGSCGPASTHLESLVRAALDSGRAVQLAVSESAPNSWETNRPRGAPPAAPRRRS